MLSFHPLKVAAVDRIAEDAVCMTLAIPHLLREKFHFDAGQYVTVRRMIDGREERRTYSIVAPPGGSALRIGVREQVGGRMSRELANRVKPGDVLEVGTPVGRFRTSVDPARTRSYVAFAAGSGITPILSLATDILAREPNSRFTLIYGNRSMARTMFLEDTLALKNRYLGRFSVHFVMSREPQHTALLNGRIDAHKVRELAREMPDIASADEYFVCGPGRMVDEVREAIKLLNDDAPVRIERFAAARRRASGRRAERRGGVGRRRPAGGRRRRSSRRSRFSWTAGAALSPWRPTDASVLEAAERAGLELPFSCRSGICATCRARIVAGEAVMAHNIALAAVGDRGGLRAVLPGAADHRYA